MQFLVSLRFNYSRAFNIRLTARSAGRTTFRMMSGIPAAASFFSFLFLANVSPRVLCPCLSLIIHIYIIRCGGRTGERLQKGGVPAAPSGTATLLRLSPNHQFHPRPILAVTDFRRPRLSWLDGRCVQGPGTYSPRHG